MIPDEIMCRTDLTHLAKCLYGYMCRKARDGRWSGGTRLLAQLCGTGHQQVARSIKELEARRLVQVLRGRSGQRPSYLIEKASHIVTLPGKKSVSHSDGASHIATEAAHIATRKRERPSESKKKPPNPQGERESSALSRNGEDPEIVAESDGRSGTRTAALALFYPSGVPDTQLRPINRQLNALGKLCDEPEQVEMRYRRWPTVFPNAGACTLRSLVKHWDRLAPPPPNPYHPSGGRSQDEP